ncbi:MAG TPA: bestrophin family ion channel [Bryobacteraceae bacterium]|jgi:putative membrane protein
MVVDNYPSWSRILRQVGRPLLLFLAVAVIATILEERSRPLKPIPLPDITLSVLGAALGVLLAFRTNSAYGRWWEARQLWGRLVNNSRSLARQAVSFTRCGSDEPEPAPSPFARKLIFTQIAYVHALRCALRNQQPWDDIKEFLESGLIPGLREQQNVAAALLQQMSLCVTEAARAGFITEWRLQRMDTTLSELTDVQGGCERIKNTPMPRQYDYYPELFVKAYCLLMPAVLVQEIGWLTPIVTVLVSFVLLVLNRIGKNLEDPFENSVYGMPMTALSRTIEINLLQALAERDLPPPEQPVDGVLW